MAEKLGSNCPCGFTFSTPNGEDEALAIVQLHLSKTHPELDRSKEAAMSYIVKK